MFFFFLLAPFPSGHLLPTSSCFFFPLVTPPLALLLLSRPSWEAQWEGNGSALVCVLVFFCVMSQYGSSIVELSFLILALTDHTAIFRFYKPFQRSFKKEILSMYRLCTLWVRVSFCASVCYFFIVFEREDLCRWKNKLGDSWPIHFPFCLSSRKKESHLMSY